MSVPYLRLHPPATPQYRSPRRNTVTGAIVVHTAENTPDYVAYDGGAEAVARYIRGRSTPGSYHDLVDSDSRVHLIDYGDEAFHEATGGNRWSLGLSIATRADVWPLAPQGWRDGAIEQAAQAATEMARYVAARTGRVPPARRISATDYRAGAAGFVSHGELDPGRRHDPGSGFPWGQFLGRYAELTGRPTPPPTPEPEDDEMKPAYTLKAKGPAVGKVRSGQVWVISADGVDAWRPKSANTEKGSEAWRARIDILQTPIGGGVVNYEATPVPCSVIAAKRLDTRE